jgi:hypothetical protein
VGQHVKEGKESYQGLPPDSFCGPELFKVLQNALIDLEFNSHTKGIAFVDD